LFGFALDFQQPVYLLGLLLLPLMGWWGWRSLSGMGPGRRVVAILLRCAVLTSIVLALAEVQWVRTSDRLAVIYVLDRSLSISPEQTQQAIQFINRSRGEQRHRRPGDLSGVIVFGREAAVELPPLEQDVPLVRVEALVDGDATDLAAALRLARACFPADCAKRLVVLSDGNENLERALDEARALSRDQIGIDVVPLRRARRGDVAVDKVSIPPEVRRGTPFDVRIVLENTHQATAADAGKTSGRLRVFRRSGSQEQLVTEQPVELEPGKRVFSFREELPAADFYTYAVEYVPDDASVDRLPENNRATAFAHVRGNGRVLLIEDWSRPGEYGHFVERLRAADIDVDIQPSNRLFNDLAELQRYDTVILANVPRASGNDAEDVSLFSDEQIEMLVRNTQEMGSGLVMLGGPESFGAGGWNHTALERAMPVDFQVKNLKVAPIGALMLVIDRSGSMSGEKLEMSKAAAAAAARSLGSRDFLGIVAFDTDAHWVVPLARLGDGATVGRRLAQLGADGGTNMMPGMQAGYDALSRIDAAVKHMIVLTDGQTEQGNFQRLSQQMRGQGITTTSVAIGSDAAIQLMQTIAVAGGGKFYRVDQPRTIPRIFMKEAMRVARPLVFEEPSGFTPRVEASHEMLGSISGPLPPLTGFVLTTRKEGPLVEVPIISPQPAPAPHPILAGWTYGLGRTVAWTTDVGQRWASSWTAWDNYDKLFAQIVRWSMRPTDSDGKLNVFAEAREGKLRVVVQAMDQDDQLLNFLPLGGSVVDPSMSRIDLPLTQFAPGRYVGECPLEKSGSYFVTVVAGPGIAPARVGVNVPYSAEFREAETNVGLLDRLAAQAPPGGQPGAVVTGLSAAADAPVGDVFRHDLPRGTARLACWHLMVLAGACLFFCDVFNRRVLVNAALFAPLTARLATLWRSPGAEPSPTVAIDRLRRRKEEVTGQLEQRRAATQMVEADLSELAPLDLPTTSQPAEPARNVTSQPAGDEPDDYTARLLKAKRAARTERGEKN